MTTLSIRLPDDMALQLRTISKHRNISLNKLMFDYSTEVLAEADANQRFLTVQLRGSPNGHCSILDELDGLRL
jgi:hypothetical protein